MFNLPNYTSESTSRWDEKALYRITKTNKSEKKHFLKSLFVSCNTTLDLGHNHQGLPKTSGKTVKDWWRTSQTEETY